MADLISELTRRGSEEPGPFLHLAMQYLFVRRHTAEILLNCQSAVFIIHISSKLVSSSRLRLKID
jgi:hypothetical protein